MYCNNIYLKNFKIEWVQEQMPKSRKKRDYLENAVENMGGSINEFASNDIVNIADISFKIEDPPDKNNSKFNDPMWSKLWYIVSILIYFYAVFNYYVD
jgi:hypothetical protein